MLQYSRDTPWGLIAAVLTGHSRRSPSETAFLSTWPNMSLGLKPSLSTLAAFALQHTHHQSASPAYLVSTTSVRSPTLAAVQSEGVYLSHNSEKPGPISERTCGRSCLPLRELLVGLMSKESNPSQSVNISQSECIIQVSLNPQTDWYVPVEWISAHILSFESIKSLQPFFFN